MPSYAVGLCIDIIHLHKKLPLAFPPDALHEAVEPYARGATLTPLNIYLSTNYNIYTEIYTTNTQKSKQIIPPNQLISTPRRLPIFTDSLPCLAYLMAIDYLSLSNR